MAYTPLAPAAPVAAQPSIADPIAQPAAVAAPLVAVKHEPSQPVASRITVRLPAEARLFVNDDPCPLTSETRSFTTPPLNPEREYAYTLRAEVVRNGQTFSEVKRVVFRGGKAVQIEFKELANVRTVRR